jgi:hypothetical protein
MTTMARPSDIPVFVKGDLVVVWKSFQFLFEFSNRFNHIRLHHLSVMQCEYDPLFTKGMYTWL